MSRAPKGRCTSVGQNRVATRTEDDDAPIETLDLMVRTYNCLKRSKIVTVHQLLALRKTELLRIRGLTPRNYEEIRERVIVCRFMSPTQLIGPFTEEEGDQDEGS
jgi:DNA-directed RNA polymerase alpha subunit